MHIQIKIFKRCFSINIGRNTPWFSQIFWFSISEEWYVNRQIEFAQLIFTIGGKN